MSQPSRENSILPVLLPAAVLLLSGCAPLLLASAGAVVGYAVSRDSVTLDMDAPLDTVWRASLEESARLGAIKKQDQVNGRIDGRIQKADVVLTLEQLTPSTVRVVIRARKNLLPEIEPAQKLGMNIARRIGQTSKNSSEDTRD